MTPPPTRILIVGGVAGGASAAARARRINEHATIILFEKDQYVSFANCGLPYYLGGEITDRAKLLIATPKLFRDRFRIDVRTGHEVTAIDRTAQTIAVLNRNTDTTTHETYDKLILAPGAAPIVPPIDGVKAPNVHTLRNLEDTDTIHTALTTDKPRHATVVGAGFIGLEMVEQLVGLNIPVTLIELQNQVLPLLDAEMAQPIARALTDRGVDLRLGHGIAGITTRDRRATTVTLDNDQSIDTDLVILGIGVRPNTKLATDAGLEIGSSGGIVTNDFMQTSDPAIYAVGDAAEYPYGPTGGRQRVPLAGPANRAGRLVGQHTAAPGSSPCAADPESGSGQAGATPEKPPMPAVYGTSIVRVFGLGAGLTGLTLRMAQRLNIDAQSVTIIAKDHAGYYPGAKPLTLKLIYTPENGRILGAQATGEAGVDKRLDVIATALALKGTVRDLAGLDLAYAPPFGSAKDPVHMAAFAACNQLDGLVQVLQPDADLTGYQLVDLRNPDEVAALPFPQAPADTHAIPLDQLRDRLDELDPNRPTVCSCATGLRSYVGCRILSQHGFKDVWNLTGAATLRHRALDG